MKNKKRVLTPSILRAILSVALLLMIAAGVGIFVLGYQQLDTVAKETRELDTKAKVTSNELQALTTFKSQLDKQSKDVERAEKIISITKNYTYQDQVVQDLVAYATASGLDVKSIDFSANNTTAASSSSSSSSSTSSAAIIKAPNGTKSISAAIALHTPVNYDNLRDFVYRIEKNLFQMQISSLRLSANNDGQGISVDGFTVIAYVR